MTMSISAELDARNSGSSPRSAAMDTPEPPAPDPIADATTTVQTFLAAALHADAPDLSDAEALRASLAAVDGATCSRTPR